MLKIFRSIAVVIVFALVSGGFAATWAYRDAQQDALAAMETDAVRSADAVSLLVRSQELMAATVVKKTDPGSVSASAADALDALGQTRPGVRSVLVVDIDGTIVGDSRPGAPGVGIHVADRAYFRMHKDGQALGPVVGPPVQSRYDGVWNLPVSVAVRQRDGSFAGVAVASVGQSYFQGLFTALSAADTRLYLHHVATGQILPLDESPASQEGLAPVQRALAEAPAETDLTWSGLAGDLQLVARYAPDRAFELVLVRRRADIDDAALWTGASAGTVGFAVVLMLGFAAWAQQVSLDRENEAARRNAALEERLRLATGAARIGVWDLDLASGAFRWDDTMHDLYRLPRNSFSGSFDDWQAFVHRDDIKGLTARFEAAVAARETFRDQFRITDAKGDDRVIRVVGRIQLDTLGEPARVVGINIDITDEVLREADLIAARDTAAEARVAAEAARAAAAQEALSDPLTGLANRRGLTAFLDRLATRTDGQSRMGCLHVDLDQFKAINDRYGHAAGDRLLQSVAQILQDAAGQNGLAARLGGDEFAVVLADCDGHRAPSCAELKALADDIVVRCRDAHAHAGSVFEAGASIGIAAGPIAEAARVAADADQALYAAKRAGRNTAMRATPALRAAATLRLETAERLSLAIAKDRISVAFQPQVHAHDGSLHGVEALVRWHDPKLGLVSPDRFLPIAEEIGAIAAVDRAVLRASLALADRLGAAGFELPRLSVNVSAERLADPGLLPEIRALPDRPIQLAFELLETIDFDRADDTLDQTLQALRAEGIAFELDDFGSGRASLTTLLRLRPDRIKLDRRLVATVGADVPGVHPLVNAIAEMGRGLGLAMTAEGVETPQQAKAMARIGCDVLQGYHIAPPLDGDALLAWMINRDGARDTRRQISI